MINTYDQIIAAGGTGVFITFHESVGRSPIPARWTVHRLVGGVEVKTDPEAHWADYGRKAFAAYGGKRKSLARAQEWASEKYGVAEWKRNGMGDYVPAEVQKQFPLKRQEE